MKLTANAVPIEKASRGGSPARSSTPKTMSIRRSRLGPSGIPIAESRAISRWVCMVARHERAIDAEVLGPVGGVRVGKVHLRDHRVEHEDEELLAVAHVGVERRRRDAEVGGQLAQAERLEAVAVDQVDRRVEDLLPGQRDALGPLGPPRQGEIVAGGVVRFGTGSP